MLRRILGAAFVVLVLGAATYVGWRWGGRIFPPAEALLGLRADTTTTAESGSAPAEAPDPDLARRTVDRVDRFRRSAGSPEMALSQAEVASVLRYSAPGVLPRGISPPDIELRGGHVHLSSRVDLEAFPHLEGMDRLRSLLPDTVPVEMDAALMPFGKRGAALVVYRLEAAGIPLPRSLVPQLLDALGRTERPGLPPEAMLVPLPAGLRSAYILADSLVLVATR